LGFHVCLREERGQHILLYKERYYEKIYFDVYLCFVFFGFWIIINLDVFNASELEQLTKVNNRMCAVKNKVNIMWQKKDGDVAELVMDLPKLLPLYYKAREAYLVAHDIIMSRIDEFSTIERGILMRYSDNCARLDAAIQEAAISENGTDNIQLVRDILVFVFLVGKVVLPMLLVL
jgi:hypothetical protein